MTRIAGIAIMLPALIVAAISTAQAQEGRTVMGPLGFSCGKWTNTAKRPTSTEHQVLKQWVLGFISGINFENTSGDFLGDKDTDGLTAWVDNYCRANHCTTSRKPWSSLLGCCGRGAEEEADRHKK